MLLTTLFSRLQSPKRDAKRHIQELAAELSTKSEIAGSIWRHKKGGIYRIVCVAYREKTLELEVVYEDTQQPVTYIRPFDEFMDGRFTRTETDT